jgi:hypothetical protein
MSDVSKTDAITELPLGEAMKIQEALKPLGYVIRGYRKKWRSKYMTVLHLDYDKSLTGVPLETLQ